MDDEAKRKTRSLALRSLLRAGGTMTEGVWGNKLLLPISRPEFQEFLAGLEGEGLVAAVPGSYGRNRKVTLTGAGRAEAIRLAKELSAETYG